jgi:hypothetical protein
MPITPGSLERVLAVANSYHEPEAREVYEGPRWLPAHDHLEDGDSALDFLGRSGFKLVKPPQPRHLAGMRQIRAAARALVTNRKEYERRTQQLLAGARYRLDSTGRLRPVAQGWDGVIEGLLPGLVELRSCADRLKLCENPQCRWLFIDRSKNRSRHWCEAATCGNRQRVRKFRRRQEAAG